MTTRDCQIPNILYDPRPLYPDMFHPSYTSMSRNWKGSAKHSTRTLWPVKYYFIDFGLSRRYDPKDGPPREHPIRGGEKSVPEFQPGVWKGELLDPFPTDIYYLGNLIYKDIMKVPSPPPASFPLSDVTRRNIAASSSSYRSCGTWSGPTPRSGRRYKKPYGASPSW